jgi:hypothetical protein
MGFWQACSLCEVPTSEIAANIGPGRTHERQLEILEAEMRLDAATCLAALGERRQDRLPRTDVSRGCPGTSSGLLMGPWWARMDARTFASRAEGQACSADPRHGYRGQRLVSFLVSFMYVYVRGSITV